MKEIEIKLVVKEDKVKKIVWKGGEILADIDVNKLPSTIRTCLSLAKEQAVPTLDDKDLEKFFDPNSRTERQKAIIKVLLEEENWISREELARKVGEMLGEEFKPHNLAGPLGGLTNRLRSEGKEELFESQWIDGRRYWRIKPDYKERIREIVQKLWR